MFSDHMESIHDFKNKMKQINKKPLRKLGIEGYFLSLIKNISKNSASHSVLSDETLSDTPLKLEMRQG